MSYMDELREKQIERELLCETRGLMRVHDQRNRDREIGAEFSDPIGTKYATEAAVQFLPEVRRLQRLARRKLLNARNGGARLAGWEELIILLPADQIAYLTVKTVLNSFGRDMEWTKLSSYICNILQTQARFNEIHRLERERIGKEGGYNRLSVLKRTVKRINPRVAKKWIKQLDDLATKPWPPERSVKLGVTLLHELCESCPTIFEVESLLTTKRGRPHTTKRVVFTKEANAEVNARYEYFAERTPWLSPMVCPPRKWKGLWGGGYFNISVEGLIKPAAIYQRGTPEPSKACLDAINRLQEVPWAINTKILDVILQVVNDDTYAEIMPVQPDEDLPPRLSNDEWDALEPEAKTAYKHKLSLIWDNKRRNASKRQLLYRQIQVAEENQDEAAIYFPHQIDFRGRAYPQPQDLHPQSDDFGKAMLVFAERKQLGERGMDWLGYHLANCYGMDKLSRHGQTQWVNDNADAIVAVAKDPLGEGWDFWRQCKAEEPWQFLAAAMEYTAMWECEDGPEAYYSNLPIHVDGSCNGLQHLSAMGRDPEGALAVNLTDAERQDIYQIVADKVVEAVEADVEIDETGDYTGGSPDTQRAAAHAWHGKVTRKTVKRAVMTVPYGLTRVGMRDQLIEDRHTTDNQEANYMRDRIEEAIGGTVTAATNIMSWMQDNAKILASLDIPITWTTPTGTTITQHYVKLTPSTFTILGPNKIKLHQVKLLGGDLAEAPTKESKQVLAIVPNIVHSFDAAHMMLTVNATDADINVAAIHDSYGTHACDVDALLRAVKQTFIEIYSKDWFASLQEDFVASAQRVEGTNLIDPPAMGDYDVEEVREAEYFFS